MGTSLWHVYYLYINFIYSVPFFSFKTALFVVFDLAPFLLIFANGSFSSALRAQFTLPSFMALGCPLQYVGVSDFLGGHLPLSPPLLFSEDPRTSLLYPHTHNSGSYIFIMFASGFPLLQK